MRSKMFYLVWNPENSIPTIKHESNNEAKTEAERLAIKHPGQEFIVLVSICSCETSLVKWQDHFPF